MVGVQWPGVGVLLIVTGLIFTLFGTWRLAYSELLGRRITDDNLEDRIKPVFEKFREKGRMTEQDAGFGWVADAIERRASKDRNLEQIESEDGGILLVFSNGTEHSSMKFLKSACEDYRTHQQEIMQWKAVKIFFSIIIAGFALQILGLIIDRIIVF